jgi:hypothetical protein
MKSGLNGGWPVRGSGIWTELSEKNDARSVEKCGKQVPKNLIGERKLEDGSTIQRESVLLSTDIL